MRNRKKKNTCPSLVEPCDVPDHQTIPTHPILTAAEKVTIIESGWSPGVQGDQLATVTAALCSRERGLSALDDLLLQPIHQALIHIRAAGIIARFPNANVTLCCFKNPQVPDATNLAAVVAKRVAAYANEIGSLDLQQDESRVCLRFMEGSYRFVSVFIPPVRSDGELTPPSEMDYAALMYDDAPRNRTVHNQATSEILQPNEKYEHHIDYHTRSSLRLIFQVLRQRVRVFSPYAGPISQRYWDDVFLCNSLGSGHQEVADGSDDGRDLGKVHLALRPPWDLGKQVRTATLSFDLRKSTFCMENADDPPRFAEWLDQMVQILTGVTHMHGGIFDKFTGDGALVHFLKTECEQVYHMQYLTAALSCAVDMHRAIDIHMDQLRPQLRRQSKLLGGAIGIDIAKANWSIDHRGNPIVVGRGVVEACRLGDETRAGNIRLGNRAYHDLDRELKEAQSWREVPFETKEVKSEMEIVAWEVVRVPSGLNSNPEKVRRLCDAVYTKSTQRRNRIISTRPCGEACLA